MPDFTITLNPLSQQPSNRFWRKYGSDRFLTIRLPSCPSAGALPHATPLSKKKKQSNFNESMVDFLTNESGIELLGRIWKLFWVLDAKDKKKDPFQAILFAVRGEGISECEIWDLLNWHIPLVPKNLEQTVPKLWSRISLGFSKTVPTVEFTSDQICPDPNRRPGEPYLPQSDFLSPEGETMDDGCCVASPAVFRRIQMQLGLNDAPTAIQGRLEGVKGLWIVCPRALKEILDGTGDPDELWIKVNKSQYKFQGHQNLDLDPAWRTLDLHSSSHPPKPATVNLQLLAILEHRGVPFEPLRDLVDDHLETVIQELYAAMEKPVLLREWVYLNGRLSDGRKRAQVGYIGASPVSPAEALLMLLDVG